MARQGRTLHRSPYGNCPEEANPWSVGTQAHPSLRCWDLLFLQDVKLHPCSAPPTRHVPRHCTMSPGVGGKMPPGKNYFPVAV